MRRAYWFFWIRMVMNFRRGKRTPNNVDITLISTFIDHNRFSILLQPGWRLGQVLMLDAAVCNPWFSMIVKSHTVMDGTKMVVWILILNKFKIVIPVCHCPVKHQVILVGK